LQRALLGVLGLAFIAGGNFADLLVCALAHGEPLLHAVLLAFYHELPGC
jgi:hypothetical protein